MTTKMKLLAIFSFLALIPAVFLCQSNPLMKSYIEKLQHDNPQSCMKCPAIKMNSKCGYVEDGKKKICFNGTVSYNVQRKRQMCATVVLRCFAPRLFPNKAAAITVKRKEYMNIPCGAPTPDAMPRTTTTPAPKSCDNYYNKQDFVFERLPIKERLNEIHHDEPKIGKPCKNKNYLDTTTEGTTSTTEAATTTTSTTTTTTTEEPCEKEEEIDEGSGEETVYYPGESILKGDRVNSFFSESTASRKKRENYGLDRDDASFSAQLRTSDPRPLDQRGPYSSNLPYVQPRTSPPIGTNPQDPYDNGNHVYPPRPQTPYGNGGNGGGGFDTDNQPTLGVSGGPGPVRPPHGNGGWPRDPYNSNGRPYFPPGGGNFGNGGGGFDTNDGNISPENGNGPYRPGPGVGNSPYRPGPGVGNGPYRPGAGVGNGPYRPAPGAGNGPYRPASGFGNGPYGPGPVNGPYDPFNGPIPSPGNGGGDRVDEVLPLPPAPQFPKGPYGQGPGPVNGPYGPFTGPIPSPGNGGGDLVAEVLPLPPAPQFPKGPYGQGPGPVNGPYGPIIGPIPSPGNGGGDLVAEVLPLPPAPQFPKGPYGQGPGPVNGPFTGPTPSPGNGPYGPGPVLEPIPNEPVSIQLSRPGIDAYIQLTCNEDAKWEVVNNDGAKIVGIEEVYCDEYTEDLF